MNYSGIKYPDVSNGTGIRVSLFVSGCRLNCQGCFNHDEQSFNFGKLYTVETEREILKKINQPWVNGLSLLGGDPLEPENQEYVNRLICKVKKQNPEKDIWLWTGRVYPNIPITDFTKDIIENIDVLVDGPFIESLKDLSLEWRGSSNQRIIKNPDIKLLEEIL